MPDVDPKSRSYWRTPELPESEAAPINGSVIAEQPSSTVVMVSPIRKEVRRRNKAHLAFVGAQPCLVCRRFPCDAHHLKFAQPRALGRKVSDEFTVPLCREHHQRAASPRQRNGVVGQSADCPA